MFPSHDTGNVNGGMYVPIGSQFPVPVFNANTKYENGSMTADILGATFGQDNIVDQNTILEYMDKCTEFINNKKPKILKDWFGKIRVVNTSVDNGYSVNSNLQTGQNTIQFSWVETGTWNDQASLYENGLVNISS